ncbi:cytochrome P450 [Sistotremastrum suecicum HHB10207 ss-3]|uniref:Cytochrome P450 n=1 Tax=Sistotremastrum suecicum HHB10207 ss-3 TaxID=1314776 RepID=A0A166A0M3_9AGAM|nr:cytochrome P450 [Sistotremastrum suecicum HHB10207 ss-3]
MNSTVNKQVYPERDQLTAIYSHPYTQTFLTFVTVGLICAYGAYWIPKKRPAGPFGLPIIGNTLQVPNLCTWQWFEKMALKYGPVAWFRIMGENVLLLSDPNDAEELLAKRANNYSARKFSIYATHYRSNNRRLLLLSDGLEFRRQRAMFKLMFRPEALHAYQWRQDQQIKKLLFDMITKPEEYAVNLTRFTSGLIMGIVYGTPVEGREEDLNAIIKSNKSFNLDGLPGMHWVDTFPWMEKLPDALAPWRQTAIQKHKEEADLFTRLALEVKERTKDINNEECFLSKAWEAQEKSGLDDLSIAYLGGSAFEAGTFVSACVLHCFMLACVNWPNFVERAQKELDDVLGDSPPSWTDRANLPYMSAVVKEALRWVPVTPLAFPHMATKDDSFKGYEIPTGTLIFPSVWNMHRDPDNFSNPRVFEPERYYQATPEGKLDPEFSFVDGHWSFGFGRRECPGNYVAGQILWGAIANLLWAFKISKAKDDKGIDVDVDPDTVPWRAGVNVEPEVFPISIIARSAKHADHIQMAWARRE